MDRDFMQRFVTGILIGAAVGMSSNHFAVWFAVGAGLGAAYAAASYRRRSQNSSSATVVARTD